MRTGWIMALALAACSPTLDDCTEAADCPADRVCADGYCLPPEPEPEPAAPPPDAAVEADATIVEEICDGADDDDDGRIDEGVAPKACAAGAGACERVGESRCVNGALICDAVAAPAGDEICNGADDDCDGFVDERPDVCCPEPERCNGEDDDCDGFIDDLPALGPVQSIDRHPAGGPFALDVASGPLQTVVLTHSEAAGRPVAHVYRNAALDEPERVEGMSLDPRATTRVSVDDTRFICVGGAPIGGGLTDLTALLFDFAEDNPERDRASATLAGELDQLIVEPFAAGGATIFTRAEGTNTVARRTLPRTFEMPPMGQAQPAPGLVGDDGVAALVLGEFAHQAWQTEAGLDTRTYHAELPAQSPDVRVEAAAQPLLFGLSDQEAVLAWHTVEPGQARLGVRTFFSGRQLVVGPCMHEAPTGVAIDATRFALGWREDGVGIVGLFDVGLNQLQPAGRLELGPADAPPQMDARGGRLTVAWLADRSVQVQSFDAAPACAAE